MRLNGIARNMMMNDQEDLYDARIGFDTYAQYIRERLKKQKNWRDMVRDAAEWCFQIVETPACTENPYLRDLLVIVVTTVLQESENYFGESHRIGESALLRSTQKKILKEISEYEEMVDENYPETAA